MPDEVVKQIVNLSVTEQRSQVFTVGEAPQVAVTRPATSVLERVLREQVTVTAGTPEVHVLSAGMQGPAGVQGVDGADGPEGAPFQFTASPRLMGRVTAGPGAGEEVSIGSSLSITAATINTIQDIRTSASPSFTGLTISGLTAGSIPFAGTGGLISQDNSKLYWDNTNKRLGVGTASPLGVLSAAQTDGMDGNATRALSVVTSLTDPTLLVTSPVIHKVTTSVLFGTTPAASRNVIGFQSRATNEVGSLSISTTQIQGINTIAENLSAQPMQALTGFNMSALNSSTGAVTTMSGASLLANNQSTGPVTTLRGATISVLNGGGGAVTNWKGVQLANISNGGGTITNTHGYYCGLVTGGTQVNTPYSFYAEDTSAWNYFGGRVGIGVTSPTNLLHVVGGDALINTLTIGLGAGQISNNLVLGTSAFASNSSGVANVAIGASALAASTSGSTNVAIGNNALLSSTTSGNNIAIGSSSLKLQTTGNSNTGVGASTLENNQIGNFNTAIGYTALKNNTGTDNTAIGVGALAAKTVNGASTAIGSNAGGSQTTGVANTLVGHYARYSGTTGDFNVAVGYQALYGGTATGSNNIAVGFQPLLAITSGSSNIAIGASALAVLTTATGAIAIGDSAFSSLTASSPRSVAVGHQAGKNITTGTSNIAIGFQALLSSAATPLTGSANIAIGDIALNAAVSTATSNIAIGSNALGVLTTGGSNVAIGQDAGSHITTGSSNFALGQLSMEKNVTSGSNTAVGVQSMRHQTGALNVAIGSSALTGQSGLSTGSNNVAVGWNSAGALTTGGNNTVVGTTAASLITTGADNTLLGYNAGASVTTGTFRTAIGSGADVTSNSTIVLGRTSDAVVIGATADSGNGYRAEITSATSYKTLKLEGAQSTGLNLFCNNYSSAGRNWGIFNNVGISGYLSFMVSASSTGEPSAGTLALVLNKEGSLGLGGLATTGLPNGIPASPTLIQIKSTNTGFAEGIMMRRGGDVATGLDLWEYGGNSQIDNWYDAASSKMLFRMRTAGTAVNALTLVGNGEVLIGTTTDTSGEGLLQLGTHTTKAGGIFFGSDVNLYRSAANTLKTDDSLTVAGGTLTIGTSGILAGGSSLIEQKDAANAQTFRVYGNTTGAKYAELKHDGTDAALDSSAGVLKLGGTATLKFGNALTGAAVAAAFLADKYLTVKDSAGVNHYVPVASVAW